MGTASPATLPTGRLSIPLSSRSLSASERKMDARSESSQDTVAPHTTHELVGLRLVSTRTGLRLTLNLGASPRQMLAALALLASALGAGGSCTSTLVQLATRQTDKKD